MEMLYNSDHFAVVRFDVPTADATLSSPSLTRGGYEIMDKSARREIYLEGALAEQFKHDVDALIESSPSEEDIDAYLSRYSSLAQHPLYLH